MSTAPTVVPTTSTAEPLLGPGSDDPRTHLVGASSALADRTDSSYWHLWMTQDAPSHVLTWNQLVLVFSDVFDASNLDPDSTVVRFRFKVNDDGVAGTSRVIVQMRSTDFSDDFGANWSIIVPAADKGVMVDAGLSLTDPAYGFSNSTGDDETESPWADMLRLAGAGNLTVRVRQVPSPVGRMFTNGELRVYEFYFGVTDFAPFIDVEKFVNFMGPRQPCAWDGGSQHFMESVTNNARYYAVHTTSDEPPTATPGFGFTRTTTSSAPFTNWVNFVRPGLVPCALYVDAETTNKSQMGVLRADGSTLTEVSRVPYPSQAFANSGFLRSWVVFPDNPVIRAYGNTSPGTPVVQAWEATVATDGTIGAFTSLGTTTWPNPGAFPGGGTNYLANLHAPVIFSDRLGIDVATRALYDRLNPTVIADAYPRIPVTVGCDKTKDQFFADARAKPGHLYLIRRNSSNVYVTVTDLEINADWSGATAQGEWHPANSADWSGGAWGGLTGNGKVVVVTYNSSAGTTKVHYDVFGDEHVIASELDLVALGYSGFGYVVPTLADSGSFLLVGANTIVQLSPSSPAVVVQSAGWGVLVPAT